jgi:hypothetical protein
MATCEKWSPPRLTRVESVAAFVLALRRLGRKMASRAASTTLDDTAARSVQ